MSLRNERKTKLNPWMLSGSVRPWSTCDVDDVSPLAALPNNGFSTNFTRHG